MATFPTGIYDWIDVTDNVDQVLAAHPNELGWEIEALEAKVGVDNSAVATSHDYKLRHLPAQEANWDAGSYEIRAQTLKSDVATGTIPISVTSTTECTNLNAEKIGGWVWASGDMYLSTNTSAPTGWTDVSATYNNKFIRISSGTPLTTGGADTHTHGAGSYAGPSHTHTITLTGYSTSNSGQGAEVGRISGSVDGHVHGILGSTISTNSDGTGTVTGTSASGDNVPAYIQLRIFQKD